jgi:hypothetical protein
MSQKQMNPAANAGRAQKCDCLAAVSSENTTKNDELHLLGDVAGDVVANLSTRRAAWIANRYPVPPCMARALAELVFDKGAAR